MKRFYITAILTLICTLASYAATIFDRYADTDGVTTVYISKAMLSMMPDMKTGGMDIGQVASKLDRIQILTCEKESLVPNIKKEATLMTSGKGYEKLMQVNDSGQKVDIFIKTMQDGKNEYILSVADKSEFTLIVIAGSITPADIRAMTVK